MIRDEAEDSILCRIIEKLQKSSLFSEMRADLQREVSKPHIHVTDMKKSIQSYLRDSGWEMKVQNAVYAQLKSLPDVSSMPETLQSQVKEPLAFIRKAQMNWEKRIVKSINSMCTELSLPLARKRTSSDQAHMSSKFETLGGELDEKQMEKIKPVYAPKDFFEALITIENPGFTPLRKTPRCTQIHYLYSTYHRQSPSRDMFDTTNTLHILYHAVKVAKTGTGFSPVRPLNAFWNKMLPVYLMGFNSDNVFVQRKFIINFYMKLKLSSSKSLWRAYHPPPDCLRCDWQGDKKVSLRFPKLLSYPILSPFPFDMSPSVITFLQDLLYFQQLKQYVVEYDMLVDSLITKDIKLTSSNDDDYFVFEDVLCQALLVFSRDTFILQHFEQSSATPPKSYIRGKLGVQDYAVVYPPNGIIPFHGFSLYASPLGYICADAPQLYFLFRQIYTKYFFRLHTMSSHPQGILSLCVLFENLLQTHEPALFYHLKEVGAHPLRLAFNWIIYAFAGYLNTEQLLLLWDRIFAYDSMELLAVLAMAILSYRRTNLLEVTNLQAAQTVLADISTLNAVALIQYVLFVKQ
ncbi:unnamed protein product [Porites evermanni]|uniref:Rab-GAP TBC domain-containing protein n=1 Tax=Porites evermanni TaxID=104178 RepID=A0ABN8MKH1_9CNID|nr:unnamed protein product [Porites evermanni]